MIPRREKDGIEILLRLTDRRGRPIRASECEDLRITVWTQDPRSHLVFHGRDVTVTPEYDVLEVSGFEMAALEPGVVVYRYTYLDHRSDYGETIVTDIKWRGDLMQGHHGFHGGQGFQGFQGGRDVVLQMVGHLKDEIDAIEKGMSLRLRDLRKYIQEEYPDELKAAEAAIWDVLSPLDKRFKLLVKACKKFEQTYTEDKETEGKVYQERFELIEASVKELKKDAKAAVKEIKATLTEHLKNIEIIQKGLKKLRSGLEEETQRAQGAEASLKAMISAETDRATEREDTIVSHVKNLKKQVDNITAIPTPEVRSWF